MVQILNNYQQLLFHYGANIEKLEKVLKIYDEKNYFKIWWLRNEDGIVACRPATEELESLAILLLMKLYA